MAVMMLMRHLGEKREAFYFVYEMASFLLSAGIGSCSLNNGITGTWKFPSAIFTTGKNKTKPGSEKLMVTRKHILGDLVTSALQSYRLSKICASKTSIELKEPVSTRSAKVDDLKKATSYLFRTKSGALVKVKVEKKREKYSIMVFVSSLELSGDDKSRLVMVWGVYRSDSSSFLPLDFENSSQDSQTHTTETPFVKSSLSEWMLGLEFDGKESPFYLSFRLKLVSGNDPNGLEMPTHRDANFCVPVGFTAGRPLPLGLSSGTDDDSWNFAFFSRNSKSVVLCLHDDSTADKPALELDLDPYVNRTGDVWHASIEKTWDFVRYGYRCKESVHPEEVDFEAEKIVLDPYATVIGRSVSQKFLGSLFRNPSFDWGKDVSPNIPLEKLIVYRLNVNGFTQHKSSKLPTNVAGTFSGVAEKVNHLQTLGTNAVLLEPIFSFSEQEGPYFPFHLFSPMDLYGPSNGHESAVNSMKEMVKKLHSHGIEVLLEVVFTHTAESGALRGIDDSSYYYKGRANDLDYKSYLNCNYPVVQQLVLESLRYWVTEFHVDGFCFINASSLLRGVHGEHLSRPPLVEAIAFDPLLAETKLIADCWDPHDTMMPKEVRFPHWKRWAELNTRYCRNVRNFVRGRGVLSDLATRICGSGDIFTDGRGPAFSFNYICRNSGLSLVDLVSFSGPELASELSWNCGEEGATNKSAVLQRRLKQIRNFLFIQYISLGIPVLNMGDECGISAKGSPLLKSRKPFDWNMLASAFGTQITQFISFMTSVRARRSDVFQRRNFLKPENIAWYANDQTTPNWEDPASKFLALGIKAESEEEETASLVEPTKPKNNDLFIGFNASDHSENVILPSLPVGSKWRRLVDTALPFPGFFSVEGETVAAEEEMQQLVLYEMKPYSCTLFETIKTWPEKMNKMNNGCCSECRIESKKTKKSKKLKEEPDEEDVKQKQKVTEEAPKTDSSEEKGSQGTSDEKKKKKNKNIVTWQHESTKKDKGHGKNLSTEQNGVNRPSFSAKSMMYNGGPNPSNRWSMSAAPGGYYPPFSRAPMYGGGRAPFQPYQSMNPATMCGPFGGGRAPFQPYPPMTPGAMYGPFGGGRGPFQPYPPMTPAPMYNGAHISPYPPMAAPVFPPYEWQSRQLRDANPMTRYTTYLDNYSYLTLS
ncbi:unnamed protein product [Thlaspi arvense]|uniref:Isoamylase 2, chloroplastic n=1 Tax=Thlaspi arvense TaxID=13288 RepID=A0AAU9RJA0_THLAR|nr:unnamed protein product [Thlaspi arvense]